MDPAQQYTVFLDIQRYDPSVHQSLVKSGINGFVDEYGSEFTDVVLRKVSEVIGSGIDGYTKPHYKSQPVFPLDTPAQSAVVYSLAVSLAEQESLLNSSDGQPILHKKIIDVLYHHLHLIVDGTFVGAGGPVSVPTAKVVARSIGSSVLVPDTVLVNERQDPPVTGIVSQSALRAVVTDEVELEYDRYFEVPLRYAGRWCVETRQSDSEARTHRMRDGVGAVISGGFVYVPMSPTVELYRDYLSGVFHQSDSAELLLTQLLRIIDIDDLGSFSDRLVGVQERIDNVLATNTRRVFEPFRYPSKIEAILRAVDSVDPSVASFGCELSSQEILSAIEQYRNVTDSEWVSELLFDITTPQAVGNILSSFARETVDGADDVTVVDTGKTNTYVLEYETDSFRRVGLNGVESLLSFPCLNAIHDKLTTSAAPAEWYAQTFVEFASLAGNSVDDIAVWFEQYEWFNIDTGRPWIAQVCHDMESLEGNNADTDTAVSDVSDALPFTCNNETTMFESVCIGPESCPYSLSDSFTGQSE